MKPQGPSLIDQDFPTLVALSGFGVRLEGLSGSD